MSKEKEKLLLSAQKLAQRGQLDKAIKEYLKVIEIDKKDVKVHTKIGDLYAKLKNKEAAIKHYLEAGKYYTKDGFYSKAIAVYKQILTLDENRDDIYLQIAELNQRLGMIGDAMAQYQRVASNYEKDGKLKEALDIFRKMAEMDPKNVMNLTKLAEIYYKNGMKKEGYQAFKRALEELKAQNRFEDYVRLMEKLAKADPDNVENLKELSQVYIKRKAYDRAYPALARIHQQSPDDLQSLTNLAQVCAKLERKEEAIGFFKELARGYQKQGLKSKAREALQKVLELDPEDELAKKVLGSAEVSGTKEETTAKAEEEVVELSEAAEVKEEVVEAGIEELDEVVEEEAEEAVIETKPEPKPTEEKLTPEQIQEHLTEADVYLKYGLKEKALTHVQSVLKADPENIEAFKRLKNIELESKNQSAALETLKKIGFLAEKKTDWKSLLDAAKEILQIKPDDKNAEAWLKKADAELTKKTAPAPAPVPEVAEEPEIIEAEEEVAPPLAPAPKPTVPPVVAKAEQKPEPKRVEEKPKPEKPLVKEEPVIDLKEDFEEAEFYAQQGLNEEALRVYLEILKKDPRNKQALSRVKELEAVIASKEPKAEVEEEEEIEVKLEAKPEEAGLKAKAELEVKEEEVAGEEEAEEGEVMEEEELKAEAKAPEPIETGIEFEARAEEEVKAEKEEVIEEEVVLSAEETKAQAEAEPVIESEEERAVPGPEQLSPEMSAEPEEPAVEPEPAISEPAPVEAQEQVIPIEEEAGLGPEMQTEPAESPEAQSSDMVAPAEAQASETVAPAEEEGLFDLAAELEKEDFGPAPQVTGLSESEKYGFNDMLKSFKDGVSKVVSEDDAATHYDLGIAYKEMGLYDDAEQEFRIALKAGHNMTDCHLMIGLCYAERGRFEKAIEEYEAGISVPGITDKEKTALFYELANSWLGLGDMNKALKMFEKTQSLDPGFRDVGARVEEIKARLSGAKPEMPKAPSREEVSWESAALSEPEPVSEEKAEAEEDKKKKSKKISYV